MESNVNELPEDLPLQTTTHGEALRLAELFELESDPESQYRKAAAELRRLHEENDLLASAADKLRITFRDERMELLRQRDQATAQRDALLEALKLARSVIGHPDDAHTQMIDAAIKAVEGEKK